MAGTNLTTAAELSVVASDTEGVVRRAEILCRAGGGVLIQFDSLRLELLHDVDAAVVLPQ